MKTNGYSEKYKRAVELRAAINDKMNIHGITKKAPDILARLARGE